MKECVKAWNPPLEQFQITVEDAIFERFWNISLKFAIAPESLMITSYIKAGIYARKIVTLGHFIAIMTIFVCTFG